MNWKRIITTGLAIIIFCPAFQDIPQENTHVTTHVTDSIKDLILILSNEMSREELQEKLNHYYIVNTCQSGFGYI